MQNLNLNVSAVIDPPIPESSGWLVNQDTHDTDPLLNMAQAVPAYPPATELRTHVAQMVMDGDTAFYTDIYGTPALRTALAQKISQQYTTNINMDDVCITAGCNHAFAMAIHGLAAPGDNVLLAAPYYFNHQMYLQMQGIESRYFNCDRDNNMQPDLNSAETMIDDKTRAIVLITPNNPTGAVLSDALLVQFYELAARHNIALVLDETYKDFLPNDYGKPHNLFNKVDWRQTLVQLTSFSKSYSLTGYRIGGITAGPELMGQITKIADTITICPSHIGQVAALFALNNLDQWRDNKNDIMQQRLNTLRKVFQTNPGGFELVSSGAYFAYVRHSFKDVSSKEVAKALAGKQNVLTLPGSFFGPNQEDYLRVAFANVEEKALHLLSARLVDFSL